MFMEYPLLSLHVTTGRVLSLTHHSSVCRALAGEGGHSFSFIVTVLCLGSSDDFSLSVHKDMQLWKHVEAFTEPAETRASLLQHPPASSQAVQSTTHTLLRRQARYRSSP